VADLGPVAWPPEPIRTEWLVLREPEARDRAAVIELLASPEVGSYLDGAMIGQVILSRATGHGPAAAAGRAGLGYLFLPRAWGLGYAAEACAAALGWPANALPGEPAVIFTQTANGRSMRLAAKLGFTEVERYEAYGAEQWLGTWSPVPPSG
jgi:RimJ/RimL family protein N-acetyltransferase